MPTRRNRSVRVFLVDLHTAGSADRPLGVSVGFDKFKKERTI